MVVDLGQMEDREFFVLSLREAMIREMQASGHALYFGRARIAPSLIRELTTSPR